jgi:phosphopantothenate synthetase
MASLRSVGDGVVIGRPNVFVSMPMRSIPIELQRLTRRANQRHIGIIADIVRPAPQNWQRAFHFSKDDRPKQFAFSKPLY